MAEGTTSRRLGMQLAYVTLAVAILFFQMLPLNTVPRGWAPPDLLLAITFAWALRRPEYLPPLAVAGVMLFADLLLHRPPGLMAVLVLIATEQLKRRGPQIRNEGFVSELILIGVTILLLTFGMRLVLSLLVLPRPALDLTIWQAAMTLLFYPLVVLISASVMGVQARTPGDQATGGRLL